LNGTKCTLNCNAPGEFNCVSCESVGNKVMCTECPFGAYLGEDGKCHIRNCKKFTFIPDMLQQPRLFAFCEECNDGYGI